MTTRSRNRYLVRKTYAFAKTVPYPGDQCEVDKTFYNFYRRHRGLRDVTPAMRQGITDHVWSVTEVLGPHPDESQASRGHYRATA